MLNRKRVICILLCQLIIVQMFAKRVDCSEYIDIEAINKLDLVMNATYAITGSGTTGMPGTGSGTMSPCTGSGTIGGSCYTQFFEPIESVFVELESIQPEYPQYILTDLDGKYVFQNQAVDFNYRISPSRDFDIYNGLSTLDVIKIVQIIFGFADDLSPYDYIAADVNQDQNIDLTDAIDLVKILIGVRDQFENGKSWVFVDRNQIFIDENNPWPFFDHIDIINLSQDTFHNDFIGVKLGDISGNADPATLQSVESRNHNRTVISLHDQYIEKGKVYTLHFNSNESRSINGMQLFLEYDKLELQEINGGRLDEELAVHHIQDKTVFMSWFGRKDVAKSHLFSIDVMSKESGKISDFIQLHQNWLASELYIDEDSHPLAIDLEFAEAERENPIFSVSQNYPNPFIDKTNIKFWIPEAGVVSLHIFNSQGQVLINKKINALQGENIIELKQDELSGTGVFQYQIRYRSEKITKSFII